MLTALGQGLYLAVAPILTRTISPADFGLYGLFFAYTAAVGIFVCLFYDVAIPAARNERAAAGLAAGALLISVITSLLGAALLALLTDRDLFGFGIFPTWAGVLTGLIMLAHGGLLVLQAWRVRTDDPLGVGWSNLSLNVARSGSQVAFALAGLGWIGLVLGELAGRLAGAAHLLFRRGDPALRLAWTPNVEVLVEHRRFPLVILPSQLTDALVGLGQLAALGYLFGPAALGKYYLMRRTLDLPLAFASKALTDLIYGRQAEFARTAPERLRPFYLQGFCALLALGLVGAAPLMIFGPTLFAWVFGADWREAGVLAAIMAPAAVMNLAVAPLARVFFVTESPHLRFSFSIAQLLTVSAALLASWRWRLDLIETTAALSAATVFSYAVCFCAGLAASARVRPAEGSMAAPPTMPSL